MEKVRETNQRLAGLELETRQPCLAMEADVTSDTKTRERTEASTADRAKHGDKSSSTQVDHDPMCLTSFGNDPLNLQLPLAGMTPWSTKTLKRQSLVSHPWSCARHQPPWLTSRRHSLYSNEDHIFPTASFLDPR